MIRFVYHVTLDVTPDSLIDYLCFNQFKERINPKMVEVNVTVCCPICEEKIELNATFENDYQLNRQRGSKSEIYSSGEFGRHMVKHTNESFENCTSSHHGLSTSNLDKLKCNRGKFLFVDTSHCHSLHIGCENSYFRPCTQH